MQDEVPLTACGDCPGEGSPSCAPQDDEEWDFVLVSDIHDAGSEKEGKKQLFLDELSRRGFTIKKVDDEKIFYGVRASEQILWRYQQLMENSSSTQQSPSAQPCMAETTRIRIVNFILQHTVIPKIPWTPGWNTEPHEQSLPTHFRGALGSEGLQDLIEQKVFEASFALHKKEEKLRKFLEENWPCCSISFSREQINSIRDYFGEKVALYFVWLSWYTRHLGIAAVVGVLVLMSGILVFGSGQVSKEICDASDTIMCPLCDQSCPFWPLSNTCGYAKVTQMIDNEGTVFFAIFMAMWATVFLELWKRTRAAVVSEWDLYTWDQDEEELMLQLIRNPKHSPLLYQHSYLRTTVILLLALLMMAALVGVTHMLVIYRVMATAAFTQSRLELLSKHANMAAVATGAVLHYVTIIAMTEINKRVALFLCHLEKPRTLNLGENNFTVKFFTFQFFTHFSSLIYVAFFLGRINGRPGNYVRISGKWRLEECHPSGCITDLFIQMSIIMLLKQTISSIMEYLIPWVKHKRRERRQRLQRTGLLGEEQEDPCKEHWLSNYELNKVNRFSLFKEFLEMVIQYSFTTIFVAAFPLAPLLAFLNNLVEIHGDAFKMTRLQQRLVPHKAKDIGIWLQILEAIGILAVIGNGLVIAITSDFIPMQVYKYMYSPCGQPNGTGVDCLTGYINHSLSVFHTRDFEPHTRVSEMGKVNECRYRDYRNPDDYSHTAQFWHILAARLAFLILFEHVALCVKLVAAWYIPDIPQSVKNEVLRSKHRRLQDRLSAERCTEV